MSRHKSHSGALSVAVTISAVIWLFGQLGLIAVLFFWPRPGGFGWPQTMWSLSDQQLALFSEDINLGINMLNPNFMIYVIASLFILALTKLVLIWQES